MEITPKYQDKDHQDKHSHNKISSINTRTRTLNRNNKWIGNKNITNWWNNIVECLNNTRVYMNSYKEEWMSKMVKKNKVRIMAMKDISNLRKTTTF